MGTWFSYLFCQKLVYGWYFYPEHLKLFKSNLGEIANGFNYILDYIFVGKGRGWIWAFIGGVMLLRKPDKKTLILLPIVLMYFSIRFYAFFNPIVFIVSMAILGMSFIFLFYAYFDHPAFLTVCLITILLPAFVFSTTFFTLRYFLVSIIGMIILLTILISQMSPFKLYLPAIICSCLVILFYNNNSNLLGDCEPGVYQAMKAQTLLYHYLDKKVDKPMKIGTDSFLLWCELSGQYTYYHNKNIIATEMGSKPNMDMYIYSTIEGSDYNVYEKLHLGQSDTIRSGNAAFIISY
jgi:hypothetical protein